MDLYEVIDQVTALLQQRGKLTVEGKVSTPVEFVAQGRLLDG